MPQSLANPPCTGDPSQTEQQIRQRRGIGRVLDLWHLSSLDAPTVAVVWCCAFGWTAGVRLTWWGPLLLALVAWTLYIADRLLDARSAIRAGVPHTLRERHFFHWRHRPVFCSLAVAAMAAGAWIIASLLPAWARSADSAIGVATLAYFSGVHARSGEKDQGSTGWFTKELLVGLLFTTGCLLPVWARARLAGVGSIASAKLAVPGVFFVALASLNCCAISLWESAAAGTQRTLRRVACGLGAAGLTAAALSAGHLPRTAALLCTGAVSAFLLAGLEQLRPRLAPLTLRAAADLVLLAPAALLLLPRVTR